MKLIVLFVIFLLLTGCGMPAYEHGSMDKDIILTKEKIEEIKKLAEKETDLYRLTKLAVENSAVEIQLHLNFNPLTHEEVMIFTGPFAVKVAEMFNNRAEVYVAAVQDIEGLGKNRVFGESIFSSQSGKVTYRHFGRDHDLRYGDP